VDIRRVAFAAFAAAVLVLPATARGGVELKRVELRDYPTVRGVVVTSTPSTRPPRITENGVPVTGLQADNLGNARSVVLAIDRSQSMSGQAFADAIAAARTFIATKHQDDRIAVVGFGSKAVDLTGFSSATIDADTALRSLVVDSKEGTALYDAVRLSAQSLRTEPADARVIIVLTDGRDAASTASLSRAVAAARAARATVYPVGIESDQFSPGPLHQLAAATGGSYRGVASTENLPATYAQIARELSLTWRVEYLTTARPGDRIRLQAAVPGFGKATAATRVPASSGSADSGGNDSWLPDLALRTFWAQLLFALLIGALILIAVWLLLSRPKGQWARERMAPHVEPPSREPEPAKATRQRSDKLAALYQATEDRLGEKTTWRRVDHLLERADLPLKTAELAWLSAACAVVAALLATLVGLPLWVALLAFAGGAVAPSTFVWMKARKRIAAFEAQLPDVLITLAASLRAGHSLRQAILAVVDEGQEPARKEFGRVLTEASLGRPMEDALADMAARLGSEDFDYVVTAVTVQRQVGGALAGLLDLVADTVRGRQQFQRKVRSLTAMGRFSALILIALPFVIAIALTLMNPEYMEPLYDTGTGHALIAIGLVGMAVGSLFLKKIVSFRG
jgi:tight adherence protein B